MSAVKCQEQWDAATRRRVEENMGLAWKWARFYAQKYRIRSMSIDDLVQESAFAIARAHQKFNPSLGFAFSTYAVSRIKQAITRAILMRENIIRIPENAHKKPDKTAKNSPRRDRCIALVKNAKRTISMSGATGSKAGGFNFQAEAEHEPEYDFCEVERVRAAILSLKEREQFVVMSRFGIDCDKLTLDEVRKKLGISRERTRQIQVKAVRKLARNLGVEHTILKARGRGAKEPISEIAIRIARSHGLKCFTKRDSELVEEICKEWGSRGKDLGESVSQAIRKKPGRLILGKTTIKGRVYSQFVLPD